MSRHVLSGALVVAVCLSYPARADNTGDKAAVLSAAISACDRGASVPLDPEAQAPVVHFGEFLLRNQRLDNASRDETRALVAQCKLAVDGAPDEKRLKLEWLRTAFFLNFMDFSQSLNVISPEKRRFANEIRRIAEGGSAEANYLLFAIYSGEAGSAEVEAASGVTRNEALQALNAAVAAGHLDALYALLNEYRHGPHLRRNPQAAVRIARQIIDLPRQGPEPAGDYEKRSRELARFDFATMVVTNEGFPAEDQAKGFAIVKEAFDRKDASAIVPYATALRYGRGVKQDAVAARATLESALASEKETARGPLADMLAQGEGGAADGKRALDLLRSKKPEQLYPDAKKILAGSYLDNRFTGRRPREAIHLLTATYDDVDALVRAAGLLTLYREPPGYGFLPNLTTAALIGEPSAAMALAQLRLSDNADFNDVDGARVLLSKLSADGDSEAAVLFAETQYNNLANSGFRPSRRDDGMTDAKIETLIRTLTERKQASAFRLEAELLRAGVIFPQDDEAATKALISAAELGDVAAMVMLGDAYDRGLGIDKDPRQRLHWWRQATRLGSLAAKQKLADAFTFDFFNRLVTLREGVTERIAVYNNGGEASGFISGTATMDVATAFNGSRTSEAGTAALAAAVMDAFRLAPAGLGDDKLVPFAKVVPDEVRIAIEAALKQAGFYAGEPKGYFGPDVRKALAAWVDAKGPLPDEAEAPMPAALAPAGALPDDVVVHLRDQAFKALTTAKDDKAREAPADQIILLARSGDLVSRWAIVSNYDQAALLQRKVTPEELTRYSLDLLVTRPKGTEKIEIQFIFDLSTLFQAGTSKAFGTALIDAVRDDPRLQDPLTLGGIFRQAESAPGACHAIAAAAKELLIAGVGDDGCRDAAWTAVIAFAKAKGPAGVEKAAREAAAAQLRKADAAVSP